MQMLAVAAIRKSMRIAIVSSPRSGNSWLRCILRDGLGLQELAVHNYLDAGCIPERCVFQLHWYREPNFQNFLSKHEFRVITIARHPLEILTSVLHFVRYEPETSRWLEGNCELPGSLAGLFPASDEFREYALSFGCENLLSVTYQWWHDHSAIRVRYEDLVAAIAFESRRIAEQLGVSPEGMLDAAAANSLDTFRALPNRHGWQGRPGLWKDLIPFANAAAIFARYRPIFETLGYSIEPTSLTREMADANWAGLLR